MTDYTNSVGPILVIGKQRVGEASSVGPVRSSRLDQNITKAESLHCNLGGTDRSSQLDRNVTKGNREVAIPSR